MPLMKPCPECDGEGGEFPIIEWAETADGYTTYPIYSEFWQECEGCEGECEVVDHDALEWAEMRHDPLGGTA